MADEVIEYKSSAHNLSPTTGILETKSNRGVEYIWSGKTIDDDKFIKYSWRFNWDELEQTGIKGFTGYIVIRRPLVSVSELVRFDVTITENGKIIETVITNANLSSGPTVAFEYYLTPIRSYPMEDIPYEVMFTSSDKTDAILEVDGKKLHVNKAFLSYHSDFFRALFSSNFKEGQMDEISIQDVSYEDFGLLLSMIHPMQSFPNDKTASKLLELADRFMMPNVIRQVEHHLLNISKIETEKMMGMADKYSMQALLQKTIRLMDSAEKAKKVKQSSEYKNLSDKTKAALFERVVEFI